MQPAVGQSVEDGKELPCRARRANELEGSLFGQAQLVHAIAEHRRMRRRQVEPPRVDFGDVGQQRGGRGALLSDERGETAPRELFSEPPVSASG
ncbi:MAG TPA: hypothetical protein VEY91_03775 [Candidatus Limnocylindria bacterium]|nr:hypothetical protein [Candidatus Limnocylindria bacterium]